LVDPITELILFYSLHLYVSLQFTDAFRKSLVACQLKDEEHKLFQKIKLCQVAQQSFFQDGIAVPKR